VLRFIKVISLIFFLLFSVINAFAEPNAPIPGKIVGWGMQVVGGDLRSVFISIAAGDNHSLGLKIGMWVFSLAEHGLLQEYSHFWVLT